MQVVDGQVNSPVLTGVKQLMAGALAKCAAAKRVVTSSIVGSEGVFFEMGWEATASLSSCFFLLLGVSLEKLLFSLLDDGMDVGGLAVTFLKPSSASIFPQLSSERGVWPWVNSEFRDDTGINCIFGDKNGLGH